MGAASKWWLHHSLTSLQHSLRERGSDLLILKGHAETELIKLCKQTGAHQVFWNRCYEPHAIQRDSKITASLQEKDIGVTSFNGSLLQEPWQGLKKDDTPYRVFTPFWKAMQKKGVHPYSFIPSKELPAITDALIKKNNYSVTSLHLLPDIAWHTEISKIWQPGEPGANLVLQAFLDDALMFYPEERDVPDTRGTSRLSPHLHFGEISPWRIWKSVQEWSIRTTSTGSIKSAEAYLRQLGWRDFSHHLLYYFPHTSNDPLDERFTSFPWNNKYQEHLGNWQKGLTGIPIVDAGMRELWHTGWMHNRVRMIVASLLTKNLLIPWQEGANWFWDTLVDADLANNTMGWQWTAGCGADAAPFFRIFNPVRQGERFDPKGRYVRKWIPELAALPGKWIHQPWEAPEDKLTQAKVKLGTNYPKPIVDLSESRKRALSAWNEIKTNR
jgi:deoxyribodipyrimidine photo-lyase